MVQSLNALILILRSEYGIVKIVVIGSVNIRNEVGCVLNNQCDTCKNNLGNGDCRLDWGCCYIPDEHKIKYLETLGKLFGDD